MPNLRGWSRLSQWIGKTRDGAKNMQWWQKFTHRRERRIVKQAIHHGETDDINIKDRGTNTWDFD